MRICYLTHNLDPKNGYGRYAAELIGGMKSRGHAVVVLKEANDGMEGHQVLRRGFGMLYSVVRVLKYMRGCDVIHALDGYPYAIIAACANLWLGKKLVITGQGTYAIAPLYNRRQSFLMRWAYRRADRLIAISRFTASEMVSKGGLQADRVTIINHGIDFAKFYVPRQPTNERYILGVGALKERKGYHISLAAFVKIAERYPDLKYYIVGAENEGYRTALQRTLPATIRQRVKFLSGIPDAELTKLYAGATLFILTPINTEKHHVEGFGLVYLEAAAAGLPVIGTLGNGAEDAIANGENGILVPQNDIQKTAEAMERILQNDELAQKLSRGSYTWARNHSLNKVVNQYLTIYREMTASGSRHPSFSMNLRRIVRRLLASLKNFFVPAETIGQSKKKWSSLARKNAKYYIWSEKQNATDEEFRASGREDYLKYVKGDAALQEKLEAVNAKTALEIGCGIGRMTEFFIPDFDRVYSIDIAADMIQQARQRLPDARYVFIEGDGVHLPIPEESVDFVFSFIVFQHMPLEEVVEKNFREVYRALRPGGIFRVQLRGAAVSKKEWFYGVAFDTRSALRLARNSGFQVLNVYSETERHLWLTLVKRQE